MGIGIRRMTQKKKNTMQRIHYEEAIWKLKEPQPELHDLLAAKNCLIVIKTGEPPYKVVIGVPHQAAVDVPHICEDAENPKDRNRPSDENAASYALVAFSTLKEQGIPSKLVIAAHSTKEDPNKDEDTDYCKEVFDPKPELLLECHGLSGNKKLDLELSAGSNKKTKTIEYGEILAPMLKNICDLGVQKTPGTSDATIFKKDGSKDPNGTLQRPANETPSLKIAEEKDISALHLEAKPRFRIPKDKTNTVTPDGLILGRALAQAIIKYFENNEQNEQNQHAESGEAQKISQAPDQGET